MNVFIHVIESFGSGAVGYNVGVVFFLDDDVAESEIEPWFQSRFEEFQATEPGSDCEFVPWLNSQRLVGSPRENHETLADHLHVFVSNP